MSERSDKNHAKYCAKHLRAVQNHLQELFEENRRLRDKKDILEAQPEAQEERLMPEGMEWPRFEDGELVRIGDKAMTPTSRVVNRVDVITFARGGVTLGWGCGSRIDDRSYGNTFKRPAPKVLDADGMEIKAGDTVYFDSTPYYVTCIAANGLVCIELRYPRSTGSGARTVTPNQLTHEKPILAADGKPIDVGQTLYGEDGKAWEVVSLSRGDAYEVVVDGEWHDDATGEARPKRVKARWLTHEKPEPADTWERIEDDCARDPRSWCAERMCGAAQMDDSECIEAWAKDLVRRAKALAERGAE